MKRAEEVCCQGVGVRNDPVAMKGSTFSSQGYSVFQRKVTAKVENRPVPSKPTLWGRSPKRYTGIVSSLWDFPLQLEASLQVKACKGNSMFNKQVTSKLTCHNQHTKKHHENQHLQLGWRFSPFFFCVRSPIDSFFFFFGRETWFGSALFPRVEGGLFGSLRSWRMFRG